MRRFRVNEPDVVYEAFDEEVVLVNLETGTYYSVRGSGPAVWMALAGGTGLEALCDAIAPADPAVLASLERFAAQLVEAQLLVALDGGDSNPVDWSGAFAAPVLETYTDMQDLLMLDPIHDVDTAGWPLAKDA